jgi:hypothetical protein
MEAGAFDLHLDASPSCGANCSRVDWPNSGTYSTHLYAQSAVQIIQAHDQAKPLFLYLAFQAVHSPDQVPQSYIDPYNASIADPKRRVFAGMLSCLDEAVGNVTAALRAAGLEGNTLVSFVADNGGPIFCQDGPCGDATGTSNFPLRGGKHTLWEGGTRLTAVVSGPMLHASGVNESGLMHHADWLPTLLEAAGVQYSPEPGFELHGASQWPMLTAGAPSSRNETVTNIDPLQPAVGAGPPGQGNAAIVTAEGWKLQLGLTGPPWQWSPPNASKAQLSAEGRELEGEEEGGLALAAAAAAAPNCSSSFAEGTCLPGYDLPGAKNPTVQASAAACCAHCASLSKCEAWTFRLAASACWVKTAPQGSSSDADCVSSASAPPAPAFRVWPLHNMTVQLFNLTVDPWEREDVAAQFPEVVARLTERLAQWGMTARDPYWRTAQVDPRSNPAKRNGTWTPWAD